MARRDRTEEFLGYRLKVNRGRFVSHDEFLRENERPIGWMEDVREIEYNIEKIESMMHELQQLHKKHLLPQFSFEDSSNLTQQIEIKTAEITRGYQNTFIKIKNVGKVAKGTVLKQEEQKMKSNIQASLAQRLSTLSTNFKRDQREYLQSLRGVEQEADEFSLDISKVNTSLNSALIEDVNFSVDMSVEREQELRNLLKSIEELNTIFKDIAILVVEQGSVLDRIDYNIQNAEVNIQRADEEIKKSFEKAKASRTKLCMILLCVCVLGLLLVVIVKAIL